MFEQVYPETPRLEFFDPNVIQQVSKLNASYLYKALISVPISINKT